MMCMGTCLFPSLNISFFSFFLSTHFHGWIWKDKLTCAFSCPRYLYENNWIISHLFQAYFFNPFFFCNCETWHKYWKTIANIKRAKIKGGREGGGWGGFFSILETCPWGKCITLVLTSSSNNIFKKFAGKKRNKLGIVAMFSIEKENLSSPC